MIQSHSFFEISARLEPSVLNGRLDEIPKITEVISEHGNFTVRLRARCFLEFNPAPDEICKIAVEVIEEGSVAEVEAKVELTDFVGEIHSVGRRREGDGYRCESANEREGSKWRG